MNSPHAFHQSEPQILVWNVLVWNGSHIVLHRPHPARDAPLLTCFVSMAYFLVNGLHLHMALLLAAKGQNSHDAH
jgi:hypothetical protein